MAIRWELDGWHKCRAVTIELVNLGIGVIGMNSPRQATLLNNCVRVKWIGSR